MKIKLNTILSCLIISMIAEYAIADSFTQNSRGGTLNSVITMSVAASTCSLDMGSINVNFNDITLSELQEESRQMQSGLVLNCDYIPLGMTLMVSPSGASTVDNLGAPGVVTASLTGTGYKLTWADASTIGAIGTTVLYNTLIPIPPSTAIELKFNITPVKTIPESILSGSSTALINMIINYI